MSPWPSSLATQWRRSFDQSIDRSTTGSTSLSNASEVKADAAGLDKTPVTPRSTTSIAEVDTAFHQHVSTWYSQSQNDSIALDSSETYQWLFPAHTNNLSLFYAETNNSEFLSAYSRNIFAVFPPSNLDPDQHYSREYCKNVRTSFTDSLFVGNLNIPNEGVFINATTEFEWNKLLKWQRITLNKVSSMPGDVDEAFFAFTGTNVSDNAVNHTEDFEQDFEQDFEYNWWALLGVLFILAGFIGNCLVCVAVATDKRLQTPTNYFLLSLAVADMLVSVVVMPLGMVYEILGGYWPFGFSTCVLYAFSDVTLCTASIMHMCLISIDRYMGISRPLRIRKRSVRADVGMKIFIVWSLSFAISCPVLLDSIFRDRGTVMPEENLCTMSNTVIMLTGSIVAFFIPEAVMVIMLLKTMLLLQKQALWSAGKREMGGASRGAIKRSTDGEPRRPDRAKSIRGNSNVNTCPPPGGQVTYLWTKSPRTNLSVNTNGTAATVNVAEQISASSTAEDQPEKDNSSSPTRTANAKTAGRMSAAATLLNKNRYKAQKKDKQIDSEKKAIKVLGIIFLLFSICWNPFFFMNTVYAVCEDGCNIPSVVFTVFLWLGWVSSTVNPMIYTVVNPNFRQAFIRLLSLGTAGKQCRGAIRSSVQKCNCRSSRSRTPLCQERSRTSPNQKSIDHVVRRASRYHQTTNDPHRHIAYSATFLSALELDNETPV